LSKGRWGNFIPQAILGVWHSNLRGLWVSNVLHLLVWCGRQDKSSAQRRTERYLPTLYDSEGAQIGPKKSKIFESAAMDGCY